MDVNDELEAEQVAEFDTFQHDDEFPDGKPDTNPDAYHRMRYPHTFGKPITNRSNPRLTEEYREASRFGSEGLFSLYTPLEKRGVTSQIILDQQQREANKNKTLNSDEEVEAPIYSGFNKDKEWGPAKSSQRQFGTKSNQQKYNAYPPQERESFSSNNEQHWNGENSNFIEGIYREDTDGWSTVQQRKPQHYRRGSSSSFNSRGNHLLDSTGEISLIN